MTIRAVADKKFLLKYLFIALACLAFSAWSLYDGFIGYPNKLPRAKAYAELMDLDQTERSKRWQVIAAENGWSRGLPDPPEEIEGKIIWQFFMAGVSALVGIPLLVWYFKTKGTWVEMADNRVTSSWGKGFDIESVTNLDKRKWEKKGIARVEFNDGGSTQKFKLDDFMYSRKEIGEILEAVEQRLEPSQIQGETLEKPADSELATNPADDLSQS